MFPVMLLSTILGLLFAFCGLMGGVAFFLEAEQGMRMSAFLQGFVSATWPVLAACSIFILQSIYKEVRTLRENAGEEKDAYTIASFSKKSTAPEAPTDDLTAAPTDATHTGPAAPVYFPVRETPLGPRILRMQSKAAATVEKEHEDTETETSEAPKMGERTAKATDSPAEQETPAAPEPEETSEPYIVEPKDDGRTFFKTR